MEEIFANAKQAVEEYAVLQLGISCFQEQGETASYSFLLLPSGDRLMASISSLGYLASNGFDFNSCFQFGIPTRRKHQKPVSLNGSFLKRPSSGVTHHYVPVSNPHSGGTVFYGNRGYYQNGHVNQNGNFSPVSNGNFPPLNNLPSSTSGVYANGGYSSSSSGYSNSPHGYSNSGSGYSNSAHGYSSSGSSYSGGFPNGSSAPYSPSLTNYPPLSASAPPGIRPQGIDLQMVDLVRILMSSGKPLVTHNGLLDLLHLQDKFLGPIPNTFAHFREITMTWGTVFDTKLLATELLGISHSGDTKLETLSPLLPKMNNEATTQYHDAGHDALITGRLFAYLVAQFYENLLLNAIKGLYANKLYIFEAAAPHWDLRPDLKGPLSFRCTIAEKHFEFFKNTLALAIAILEISSVRMDSEGAKTFEIYFKLKSEAFLPTLEQLRNLASFHK